MSLRAAAAEGALRPGWSARIERTFRADEIIRFGEITVDYNPVHYEPRWVRHKGYRSPICHGLLVGSMLCDIGGQLGWLATGMSFRFRRPVYVGDTITCELTIEAIDERRRARGRCLFTNQQGERVLEASLEGYLPDAEERQLLGQMLAEGDPTNRRGGG
jgi:acyl dehydratase